MKLLHAVFSATLALSVTPLMAQTYPAKAIRIVVPFPAGGPLDIVARAIGQDLNKAWNQPVIIDNRPGAGGVIGLEMAARAASRPRELLKVTKRTIQDMAHVAEHPAAVERELDPQVWSTRQPWFGEMLAKLQAQITKK